LVGMKMKDFLLTGMKMKNFSFDWLEWK
jgi:hypothetical protein